MATGMEEPKLSAFSVPSTANKAKPKASETNKKRLGIRLGERIKIMVSAAVVKIT